MKTALLLLLLLAVLSLAIKPELGAAENGYDSPVFDADGNELRVGARYYIMPAYGALGGGLTLSPTRNRTCPLDVVQDPYGGSRGLPATFLHDAPRGRTIHLNKAYNIKFSALPTLQWKVTEEPDEEKGKIFVTTGPEANGNGNGFRIQTYGHYDYKLVYCSSSSCGDLGISVEHGGVRRLAMVDSRPFKIMFVKDYYSQAVPLAEQ